METDQLRGVYFDSRKGEMKLTEYARDKWLPAQLHLRPNSVETYTYHLEKHIIPAFGTWRLAMIGREDVQKFVIALTKKPATAKKDGRKLAATTIETIFSVLRMLMQSAVDSGMIGANPCTRVRLPAKSERVIEPLPAEAVIALAKAITPRYRLLVLLAAMAGLREGEAFGLTVGKVEFLRRRIHVHQQAQSGALAPLKTDKSMRTIPADDMLIAEITRHMQRWPKGPDGTIVTNRLGRTVKRSSFSSCWSEAVEKAGLPKGTRFHDLRHFYASALIKANLNPKVIQSRLGHASIAETMDTYGHLFPDDAELGRGALEALLVEHGMHQTEQGPSTAISA
jgi:integrase